MERFGRADAPALVRGVEPDLQLVECFGTGSTCALTGRCGLAGMLEGALQCFLSYLDGFTLADALETTGAASVDWHRVGMHPRTLQ